MDHPMYDPAPAAEALCAARDEVAALEHTAGLLDREHVLGVLRRHIDAATPNAPEAGR